MPPWWVICRLLHWINLHLTCFMNELRQLHSLNPCLPIRIYYVDHDAPILLPFSPIPTSRPCQISSCPTECAFYYLWFWYRLLCESRCSFVRIFSPPSINILLELIPYWVWISTDTGTLVHWPSRSEWHLSLIAKAGRNQLANQNAHKLPAKAHC